MHFTTSTFALAIAFMSSMALAAHTGGHEGDSLIETASPSTSNRATPNTRESVTAPIMISGQLGGRFPRSFNTAVDESNLVSGGLDASRRNNAPNRSERISTITATTPETTRRERVRPLTSTHHHEQRVGAFETIPRPRIYGSRRMSRASQRSTHPMHGHESERRETEDRELDPREREVREMENREHQHHEMEDRVMLTRPMPRRIMQEPELFSQEMTEPQSMQELLEREERRRIRLEPSTRQEQLGNVYGTRVNRVRETERYPSEGLLMELRGQ